MQQRKRGCGAKWGAIGWLLWCAALSTQAWAENLYQENAYQSMVADRKAYRIGDNLTVLIVETASASASVGTSTDKEVGIGGTLSTPNKNKAINFDLNQNFSGDAKTARTGRLLAQITVNVQEVAPNGDLHVKGKQWIQFNDEKQQIALEGKIRPEDIGPNNTVLSTRVGEAQISYVGRGVLGETQRPGILSRILSWFKLL